MAKKKQQQSIAPVPLTRGQLSRAARERQQLRNLYGAAIAIGTLVVLILGLAAALTYVVRPNEQVAKVNDHVITRATYEKLRRWNLFQSIQTNAIQQQLSQQTGSTVTGVDQLQLDLQNVSKEATPDATTVRQLQDDEVLRQKSQSDLGVSASTEDLKAYAIKDFLPQPTPHATPVPAATASPTVTSTQAFTPTATPSPTITPSPTAGSPTRTPTPSPTLPPVPGAQQTAESVYVRYAKAIGDSPVPRAGSDQICAQGCPQLSESDYLSLVIEPRYRKDKATEKLAATGLITTTEQIHAQHILTDTEEGAKKLHDMLDKGADFTQLANTQSSEQISNLKNGGTVNGGDLGWFPKENSGLVQEFADAAFTVPAGKYGQPVHTQFGWHIIKVIERDPHRPLSQTQIDSNRTKLYDEWFAKVKAASTIIPAPATPTAIPTLPAPPVESTAPATPSTQGTPGAGLTPAGSATSGITSTVGISATLPVSGTVPAVATGTSPAASTPGGTAVPASPTTSGGTPTSPSGAGAGAATGSTPSPSATP